MSQKMSLACARAMLAVGAKTETADIREHFYRQAARHPQWVEDYREAFTCLTKLDAPKTMPEWHVKRSGQWLCKAR